MADLGPIAGLIGQWKGTGFNTIWRPARGGGSDRFLELNLTSETLQVEPIPGDIPNRGFLQGDLTMSGLRYLQQISDSNLAAGLHVEPGVWLSVPATTDPPVPASVVRMGTVPHGTSFVAQGIATSGSGAPAIPATNIDPFSIGSSGTPSAFPEQELISPTAFRTDGEGLIGIDQSMVDNPNSILTAALAPESVGSFVELNVSSDAVSPILGGGTSNSAFLQGGPDGPNAVAARIDASLWIVTLEGQTTPSMLLYSQIVLLNFNGISWPHVSVGVLRAVTD